MTNTEINEAIARKLGWTQIQFKMRNGHKSEQLEGVRLPPIDTPTCPMFSDIPNYCTNIADAWEIVEKSFSSFYMWYDECSETWTVDADCCRVTKESCKWKAHADTAPHAICLAFLKLP
jgi:hypothetical protein